MTTIIADLRPKHPIMTADNQEISCPGFILPSTKIFRIEDGPQAGHLVGCTGASIPSLLFIKWYTQKVARDWSDLSTAGIDIDIAEENFECIILQPKGIFVADRFFLLDRINAKYYAGGSGAHFAIGAMDYGAPPSRALDIACRRDAYTSKMGRPAQLMTL